MANKNFKYIVYDVKAVSDEERKVTTFKAVGVPFGGPDYLGGKDLTEEFFAKDTDYGRNSKGELLVKTVFAYYDHALRSAAKSAIGSATFTEEDDEGLHFDIEVEHSNKYHAMLLALAEKKFLGASSQPVQTSVEIDPTTGKIKRWHVAELSLTPRPANPNAVVEVMKSFNIDEDEIAIYKAFAKEFEDEAAEDTEDVENTEETPVPTNDVDENGLSEEIAQLFGEQSQEVSELQAEVEAIKSVITAQTELINAQTAEIQTLKSILTTGIQDIVKNIIANRNGIKSFAESVAKDLRFKIQQQAQEEEQMSEDEREAQRRINKTLPGPKGR